MMLSENEFRQNADSALEALYSKLAEASDDYDFDVDMNAGALSVEFESPKDRFVVSPNAPVRQIWVSAHVQSYKFDWDGQRRQFVLPDSGLSLEEMMADAIRRHIPEFSF